MSGKKVKITLEQRGDGTEFFVSRMGNAVDVTIPVSREVVRVGTVISDDVANKLCQSRAFEVTVNANKPI